MKKRQNWTEGRTKKKKKKQDDRIKEGLLFPRSSQLLSNRTENTKQKRGPTHTAANADAYFCTLLAQHF